MVIWAQSIVFLSSLYQTPAPDHLQHKVEISLEQHNYAKGLSMRGLPGIFSNTASIQVCHLGGEKPCFKGSECIMEYTRAEPVQESSFHAFQATEQPLWLSYSGQSGLRRILYFHPSWPIQ